jgi:CRISPR-associated exonuclease Cas4
MKKDQLIPSGDLIYDDLCSPSKILYSNRYGLSGKPDYILKNKDGYIPVEVKIGQHCHPQRHHIMQLICYGQIVKDHFGQSVPYGILVYYDTKKQFSIAFTREREKQLKQTVSLMRRILDFQWLGDVEDLIDTSKCMHCSMRKYCDFFQNKTQKQLIYSLKSI